MTGIWLIPFALQAMLILIDEFYFHRKRGLPPWELVSHPVDTFLFIGCLAFALFVPPGAARIWAYVVLATVTALAVTKDEFVHAERASKVELWVHSLLFLIHPVLLIEIGLLWSGSAKDFPFSHQLLTADFLLASLFLFYQLFCLTALLSSD